ncbi:MAG: ROK family protein [Pseudomonadota bacterium]|nr:ROK family protein [Pseudomonadota bacterium]
MKPQHYRRVLAIDIGGSHVKARVYGRKETRKFDSGPHLTPNVMVAQVHQLTGDWVYEAVSIGYPGVVIHGKVIAEPHHLGPGWVGFDFRKAFARPTHVLNDAAMQAIGSYEGGRMLFLGLGTGLGSAMIVDGIVAPMELAHLPFKKGRSYEDYVGERGMKRLGRKKWRDNVAEVVHQLKSVLEVDYVVIGGGNAGKLKQLPPDARLGSNDFAFVGGFRMWRDATDSPSPGKTGRGRIVVP